MIWLLLALAISVCVLAFALIRARRSEPSDRQPRNKRSTEVEIETSYLTSALESGSEIFLPTGRANEFIVLGSGPDADDLVSSRPLPKDLTRAAAGISTVVRGAVEAAQVSGRLVIVDGATATAIRQGSMVADKSGKTLAVVKNASGKFEHITRISPVAGKAAGVALGAANVVGAIGMQMQMASIEAKLGEIVKSTGRLEHRLDLELHSSITAARKLVEEVYGASRDASSLPAESWAQLAPHYHTVLRDQAVAIGSIKMLIEEANERPDGFWLGTRESGLKSNKERLIERLAVLHEADQNVIRMNVVRLWHYAATQPELAPHFASVARDELLRQETTERELLRLAKETFSGHAELGRLESTFHWWKSEDFTNSVVEISQIPALPRLALDESSIREADAGRDSPIA